MLRRLVGWFVLIPLCAILIVFALANRQLVVVNFNPFVPADALAAPGFGMPLFLVIYAVLIIGVLMGGIATWFAQGHNRRERRMWQREAGRLNSEIETLRRPPPQARGTAVALAEADELVGRS